MDVESRETLDEVVDRSVAGLMTVAQFTVQDLVKALDGFILTVGPIDLRLFTIPAFTIKLSKPA